MKLICISNKECFLRVYGKAKPYLSMIFLQTLYAVNGLILKSALNKGLNNYTFAVYRNAVAALFFAPFALLFERKERPKMTISIFLKIVLLGLLEPVIDQNLYYMGMKYTTATFATAMCNMLPAITFVMAWIFRLEKVKINGLRSQGKIVGTLVTIGGAMIMTLVKGPGIQFPWTSRRSLHHDKSSNATITMSPKDQIKGSLMITGGCFSWASFVILQAVTLKLYPADLSLTALICVMGAFEGSILALVAEKAKTSIWSIHWDIKLFAILYNGIACAGIGYYISGVVMKEKGPVFVTASNPLGMVIIAIMESSILAEKLSLGSVVGGMVIVTGLYLVIWGKSKDQSQSESVKDQVVPLDQKTTNGAETLTLKHELVDYSGKGKTSADHEDV